MSRECWHLVPARGKAAGWFTPKEMEILQELLRPIPTTLKLKAEKLKIGYGTLKIYMCHIYEKLGWPEKDRSAIRLALWAIAYREQLGMDLPSPEQFKPEDTVQKFLKGLNRS